MKTRYERKVTMKEPITLDEHQQLAASLVRIQQELADIERWMLTKRLRSWAGMPTRLLRARNHLSLLSRDLIGMLVEDHDAEARGPLDPVELYLPGPLPQLPRRDI